MWVADNISLDQVMDDERYIHFMNQQILITKKA